MCAAVQSELGALVDGELCEEMVAEVQAHATSCPVCARVLRELRALRDRVRRVGAAVVATASLRERALEASRRTPLPERGG